MGGLFGKLKGRAKDGSLFNSFGAAGAFLQGNYGQGAAMLGQNQEIEDEKAKQKLIQQARLRAYQWAKGQGYEDNDAMAFADNPKIISEIIKDRDQTRQFGPGGGSLRERGPDGQMTWQMAPSRHEYQGSVFDVGPATPGQTATVTPQQQGTQWVTPQPGTTAFGVNSFTGARRMGPPPGAPMIGQAPPPEAPVAAPTAGGPVPGTVEDGYRFKGGDPADARNWVPVQGGAGSRGPRNFPGPY